jgi:hypothetical protein
MRSTLLGVTLFVLACAPLSVSAEESEGEVYIYGGLAREDARIELQRLTGERVSENELISLPNVGLPVDDDIWFVGAPEARRCEQVFADKLQDVSGGDVSLLVQFTENMLTELNIENVGENISLLRDSLPCVKEELSRDVLSRIFFLLGAYEIYRGGSEDAAREQFIRSVQLGGSLERYSNYPPNIQAQYGLAASEAKALGWTNIDYNLAGLSLESLLIDGVNVELGESASGSARVLPGVHVVQWKSSGGELRTRMVDVPKMAFIISSQGLQEILARQSRIGETDSTVGFVQESYLTGLSSDATVLIAHDGVVEFAYEYDGARKISAPVKYLVGAPKDLVVRQQNVRYKPVEARIGGGYVLGTTFAVFADASFWLNRHFAILFGADAAFTGYIGLTREENRVAIMPSTRFGARVEFRGDRLIKPHVFALARVSFAPSPTTSAGPIVGGGATFMAPLVEGKQIFGIALDVGGGPMFSPAQDNRVSGTLCAVVSFVFREFSSKE